MIERTVAIVNRLGLHARPAAEFVKVAGRFACEVKVRKDAMEVNGKSIMGMMMLAAEQGARLVIQVNGDDGAAALDALEALIRAGFGED